MRISDWSSDVCSSDLHESLPRPDRSPDCLLVTEEILERSLRQRHEEPDLKEKEQSERHRQADNRDQVPGKAAKPAHDGTDEERSGHVDADEADGDDEDSRRHQHHPDVGSTDERSDRTEGASTSKTRWS